MSANPQNPNPGLNNSEPSNEPTRFSSVAPSRPPSLSNAQGHEALQALLAFSSLHERIRARRAREQRGEQSGAADAWQLEQFVLDEVLQLVAEPAPALRGGGGIAIAVGVEYA